jgi:hypothetical protein
MKTRRRHRIRNASAGVALVLIGITLPLTITKGNRIYGGNVTLAILWTAIGVSAFIWLLATDLVVERSPVTWRGFHKGQGARREADPLRVALYAVREELGTCGTIINEARSSGSRKWWHPAHDPLPGQKWDEYHAELSQAPDALHNKMSRAYQKCNRLNHRIRGYITSYRQSQVLAIPMLPAGVFAFRDDDEAQLDDAIRLILDANFAITGYLKTGNVPKSAADQAAEQMIADAQAEDQR